MVISILHRKEQLILTAIDIINELGIQKLTTREIAKRQNISEATLFRHFKNKNELVLAVLDYFIQFDSDILQSAKLKYSSPKEALVYFLTSIAEYYENYPAITTLLQTFDLLIYEEDLADRVKEIQRSRISMIAGFVEEAKQASEVQEDLDSENIALIISGYFRELCFHWKMNQYSYSLRDHMISTLKKLIGNIGK